jgi:hypothetical protein
MLFFWCRTNSELIIVLTLDLSPASLEPTEITENGLIFFIAVERTAMKNRSSAAAPLAGG